MLKYVVIGAFALVAGGAGVFVISPGREVAACVPGELAKSTDTVGYELVDIVRREVWATRDWTPETFAAFSMPVSWSLWGKNGPRVGLADEAVFLKSPGCAEGEYSTLAAFDRNLFQVVKLKSVEAVGEGDASIRQVTLEKHHVLTYFEGRTVRMLLNPEGEQFIAVAEDFDRPEGEIPLPPGWTLKEIELDSALTVNLVGEVTVIRLDNDDSYQGPVEGDFGLKIDVAG